MIPSAVVDGDGGTRVGLVMQAVRARISGRVLAPGARLPSIRAFSETMAVSKSTVVEAYDRLAAEGAEHIHIYTLNNPDLPYDVCRAIGYAPAPLVAAEGGAA